jgi:acetamidase/formamidase
VSEACDFPFLNPQTGPFYVEGAEVGDTVAVHFVSIEPARDWAASTTVPFFGALTSTQATATLQPPLPEAVWMWQLDLERRTCLFAARDSDVTVEVPLEDAFRIAQLDLVQWLARDYGLSQLDAYQLVTQGVESPLANVCDTNYTALAKFRKAWLPAGDPHRGLHQQLRETAARL